MLRPFQVSVTVLPAGLRVRTVSPGLPCRPIHRIAAASAAFRVAWVPRRLRQAVAPWCRGSSVKGISAPGGFFGGDARRDRPGDENEQEEGDCEHGGIPWRSGGHHCPSALHI